MKTRTSKCSVRLRRPEICAVRRQMTIGLHLEILIVGELCGFLLGPLILWALCTVSPPEFRSVGLGGAGFLFMWATSTAGVFGMRFLLRQIRAVCPKCGGSAVQKGIRPRSYHCTKCGHIRETRISSNW